MQLITYVPIMLKIVRTGMFIYRGDFLIRILFSAIAGATLKAVDSWIWIEAKTTSVSLFVMGVKAVRRLLYPRSYIGFIRDGNTALSLFLFFIWLLLLLKKLPRFKDSALRSTFITKVSSLLWLRLTSAIQSLLRDTKKNRPPRVSSLFRRCKLQDLLPHVYV